MSNGKSLSGKCFCGAVEITVDGEPMAMGYCHCDSCREWSAGPVNAFSLWPPEAVHVTRGSDKIGSYQKTEKSVRKWCTVCGGHLLTEHPPWGVTDVYAAVLPDLDFQPVVHVNYETTVLHLSDGLPKQKDFPAEMGGSGVLLPD
ncbi:GFA family protein [Agrobacterium rhizogenes]|uniref:GFA family protein n=2 Tax=unclassified Rhizobium TaxID=2613769 RepID=A0AAU7SBY5_9HYPH|nr:GFA family protein [Rhizobium rhizogenes]NTJ81606.1 GFA family protein [Rhizobium rhizogenes]